MLPCNIYCSQSVSKMLNKSQNIYEAADEVMDKKVAKYAVSKRPPLLGSCDDIDMST